MTTLGALITSQFPFIEKFKSDIEQNGRTRTSISSDRTPRSPNKSAKCVSEAVKYRNAGNESYGEKRFDEAVEYYSRSVAAAPVGSRELALAYGNRSAALHVQGRFEHSLLDINRALSEPSLIPEMTREKLLKRKTRCWELLEAENAVKTEMLNALQQEKPGQDLNVGERLMLYRSEMSIDQTDLKMNYALFDDPIWNTKLDQNALLPNVSPKVKLEQNQEWGLHWVATDDIAPGEVLLLQEYYSMKLLQNASTDYCAYCTLWCTALIPCPTCQEEMYCSVGCQQKAFDLYHRTECKIQQVLELDMMFQEMLVVRSALRAFLRGTKQGSELMALMTNPAVLDILSGKWSCKDQFLSSDDYVSILSLPWKSLEDSSAPPSVIRKLNGLKSIFYALWRVDFFDAGVDGSERLERSENLTDVELFAALILSHNLFVGQSGSPIFTRISGGKNWKTELTEIGSGFGTLRNFMNQSCIANTDVITNKRRLLVYCSKSIKAGEQIFTAYEHADYLKSSKCCRVMYLKEISKVCKCRACVEDWPGRFDLMAKKEEYLTSDQTIIQEIERMHAEFSKISRPGYEYEEDDLRRAFEFRKNFHEYVKEPSPTMFACELFICQTMITKGNFYCSESIDKVL